MKIAMIGAGYVGLVSGACFSEFGFNVVCVDNDPAKITALQNNKIPFYEPGLEHLVAKNAESKRLTFSTDLAASVKDARVVFIAVGTPSRRGDGHADLTYVYDAVKQVAAALTHDSVIVTKSTVPVGTYRAIEKIVKTTRPDLNIAICSNPEFLREGSAIDDFMRPDRIVIGTEYDDAIAAMRASYRPLYLNETPFMATAPETAELIKYAANAFLAMKITFINEIADLAEKTGADVQDVARGIGLDGRIGRKFLHAGPGYGGSCFPKDTRALSTTAEAMGSPVTLIDQVIRVNDDRKHKMAQKIMAAMGGSAAGKTVAVLGVTFKPNTDDMRDAPSLSIIPALQAAGVTVRAYDPAGMPSAASLLPNVVWCNSPYEAAAGADAATILTEWNEFRALDFVHLKQALSHPVLVDLRNIYKLPDMQGAGFDYYSIGRAPVMRSAKLKSVAA